MASLSEVLAAVDGLAARLAALDDATRTKHAVDRTLACRVPALEVVLRGVLCQDGLTDVAAHPTADRPRDEPAQLRMSVGSDDLVALAAGELSIGRAWASGRLKLDASVGDLLRLRSLL